VCAGVCVRGCEWMCVLLLVMDDGRWVRYNMSNHNVEWRSLTFFLVALAETRSLRSRR
jgi:hypothetical protein